MTASDRPEPVLGGLGGILADLEDFYKDLHANPELSHAGGAHLRQGG